MSCNTGGSRHSNKENPFQVSNKWRCHSSSMLLCPRLDLLLAFNTNTHHFGVIFQNVWKCSLVFLVFTLPPLTLNTCPCLIWWVLRHANAQFSERKNQKENCKYVTSSVYSTFATCSHVLAVNACKKWRFSKTSCRINKLYIFVQAIYLGLKSISCSMKDKMYWNRLNLNLGLHWHFVHSGCWPGAQPDLAHSDLENSFTACHVTWSKLLTLVWEGWVIGSRHVSRWWSPTSIGHCHHTSLIRTQPFEP